jgi:hypothetical protein
MDRDPVVVSVGELVVRSWQRYRMVVITFRVICVIIYLVSNWRCTHSISACI